VFLFTYLVTSYVLVLCTAAEWAFLLLTFYSLFFPSSIQLLVVQMQLKSVEWNRYVLCMQTPLTTTTLFIDWNFIMSAVYLSPKQHSLVIYIAVAMHSIVHLNLHVIWALVILFSLFHFRRTIKLIILNMHSLFYR